MVNHRLPLLPGFFLPLLNHDYSLPHLNQQRNRHGSGKYPKPDRQITRPGTGQYPVIRLIGETNLEYEQPADGLQDIAIARQPLPVEERCRGVTGIDIDICNAVT